MDVLLEHLMRSMNLPTIDFFERGRSGGRMGRDAKQKPHVDASMRRVTA